MTTLGHASRPALALALSLALLLGCRRPAPSTGSEPWRAALAGHAVFDASPLAPLRYALPHGCRLAYEWSSTARMAVLAPTQPRIADSLIESTGRAEAADDPTAPGRLVLRFPWRRLSLGSPGARNPGNTDEDFAAPVWLRTDGEQWREEDGPAATWSAYGSFHGLVRFFPALPAAARGGARRTWRYAIYSDDSAAAVEARRGRTVLPAGATPPPPRSEDQTQAVTLARWITVDGHLVAALDSTGEGAAHSRQELSPTGAVSTDLTWRTHGAHLVLARSGRLLLSRFEDVRDVRMQVAGTDLRQRHTVRGELRLVSACDGVVLASPIAPRAGGERALDAAVTLRDALIRGDRAAVTRSLSPALRARHGDAVVDLLLRHVRWHGPESLGSPEIADEAPTRTADGAWRLQLLGGASAGSADRTMVHTVMEIETAGDALVVRSIATSRVQGSDARDVLDVSADRLFSDATRDG